MIAAKNTNTMGCGSCGKKVCCCEKRISLLGKKADQGPAGQSTYTYIAYADEVTAGTPDVVIGFSTTVPKCWVAVITSIIPLTPVEANFQGMWFNRCVSPCTCDVTGDGASASIDQTINSAVAYVAVTGAATAVLPAGTYLFWGEIDAGISVGGYMEYTLYDGAPVGINRRTGDVLGTNTETLTLVHSINEKLVLAAPAAITIAVRTPVGTVTIIKRSLQYIKIG